MVFCGNPPVGTCRALVCKGAYESPCEGPCVRVVARGEPVNTHERPMRLCDCMGVFFGCLAARRCTFAAVCDNYGHMCAYAASHLIVGLAVRRPRDYELSVRERGSGMVAEESNVLCPNKTRRDIIGKQTKPCTQNEKNTCHL